MEASTLIEEKQINLKKKYFKKLKKLSDSNIIISKSALAYACTWYQNLSFYHIKLLQKKNLKNYLKFFYYFLKDFLVLSTLHNYKIKFEKNGNYENLIMTWAKESDFNSDNNYNDRFFANYNNSKENLWFVIGSQNLDKIQNPFNCILIYSSKNKLQLWFLIKNFIKFFIKEKFSLNKLLNYFNFYSQFAEYIKNNIIHVLKKSNVKNILLPFEGQPFQEYAINEIKKKFPKIIIKGYAHASQPFPIHLSYKNSKLDYLVAHSKDQYFHLTSRLNWPKEKVLIEKNPKILKIDSNKYVNKIFFPYGINSPEFILNSFKVLNKKNIVSLKKFSIKNHPIMSSSPKHIKTEKLLSSYISNLLDTNSNDKDNDRSSIVVGATSSVPEALQSVESVFHVCEDPVIQTYSKYFWPNINVEFVSEKIVKYTTKDKNNLLCF